MQISRTLSRLSRTKYDAVVIGAGHNGLIAASYLAKTGKSVAVVEKRHVIGGAAVTEEIVPGYRFSRASYVLSLLRPKIIEDLELKKHGLKYHKRHTSAFVPMHNGKSLTLSMDHKATFDSISQFSKKDAEQYFKFEDMLAHYAKLAKF